jgi:hypothetical protein
MAIKGKSKPKGGARTVTRGPKPAYVPVRRPLLRRRGFWLTVLAVAVVVAVVGTWFVLAREASQNRDAETAAKLKTAGTAYQQQIDPILATVGQAGGQQGTEFAAFQGLEGSLTSFVDGKGSAKDLRSAASGAEPLAKKAAQDLGKVDALAIVQGKGFAEPFVLFVLNSQKELTSALRLYDQAALLAQDAVRIGGAEGATIAGRATAVLDDAKTIFQRGYQDYLEVQFTAGIFQSPVPGLLPGSGGASG